MILVLWYIALVFLVIQLTLYIYGIIKIPVLDGKETPLMSVVIAAKNEAANLCELLPLLRNQKYPDFEVIIALDRCEDDSIEILKNYHGNIRFIDIEQVPTGWDPKKNALNEGIKIAKGAWLVLTDADCRPHTSHWLSEVAKCIDVNTNIVIGLSPYMPDRSFRSKYVQYENFLTALSYTSFASMGRPYMAVGRNLAIRKSFFQSSGGYERLASITGGDDDLFIQRGATSSNTRILVGEKGITATFPKTTWKKYFTQKKRHLSVGSKYKRLDQFFLSTFHAALLLFYILIPLLHTSFFVWLLGFFYLFVKFVGYRYVARKLGIEINYMLVPLVDLLYAVLLPVIVLWSKLEKDNKWKN